MNKHQSDVLYSSAGIDDVNEKLTAKEKSDDLPMVCRACEARHRGICGALNPEQLVRLNKHTTRHPLDKGRAFHEIEKYMDRYANILSGVVKLTKLLPDGRQQIVGLQFAPDFVGRPFGKESRVSAEAGNGVTVCSFPRKVIEDMISESSELEHKLHQQALKELDEAWEWMLALGRKTAQEKVASFLHMIAVNYDPEGVEDTVAFELPLTRLEMADFLGLTTETVSRQMTKLRKSGIITIQNNRLITVQNMERLEDSCGSA